MTKANLLIVDDHPSVRKGYCSLLQEEPFINAVYEAEDEPGFLHAINNHPVDIILLDIKLKDISGLELLPKLKGLARQPRVVALTGLEGEAVIINILKAGVSGIVHKLDEYEQVVRTIESVWRMGTYYSPYITRVIQANCHRWSNVPPVVLTPREKEVLKAVAEGLINAQIADLHKMTERSMEKFRTRLMDKVGVPNAPALLAFAYRNGIL
jgi:two-component system, NarL family, response regulator DegU